MMDPYAVLGVERGADAEVIRQAGRKRSRETHPDAGGRAEEFHRVRRAVSVLSDPERRRKFDETGHMDEGSTQNDPALSILASVVHQILADEQEPWGVDLVSAIRQLLDLQIRPIEAEVQKLVRAEKRGEKLIERLHPRKSGGPDPMRSVISGHLREIRLSRQTREQQIAALRRASAIVEEYVFDRDQSGVWWVGN